MPVEDARRRADEILGFVALARAMASHPKLLLLDDPLLQECFYKTLPPCAALDGQLKWIDG